MLYKRKWSSKVLPSQHCWCNQIDVISFRMFFHLKNHCSTPFSFSFLTNPSSFFCFLVSSSLVLCISFYFLIIYFPPCVPHKFIFFSSLFSFLLTFTLFLYIYSCFNYKKKICLEGCMAKRARLKLSLLIGYTCWMKRKKTRFYFIYLHNLGFKLTECMLYMHIPRATITFSVVTT